MPEKLLKDSDSFWKRLTLKKALLLLGVPAAVILFFCCAPYPNYHYGFENLGQIKEYGKTVDEWLEMENTNPLRPVYDKFYQENYHLTFAGKLNKKIEWLASMLYLKRVPFFSESFFKNLLHDVSMTRLDWDWQGDFIQKIEVNPDAKIVVFGVVQGAFHSLIRYMEKLVELEIIDENLRLKSDDYFLVFKGNVANRSAYNLEILSIVLRLMQENPERVIYLKGPNEFFNYWSQESLRAELDVRMKHLSLSKIPMQDEIKEFFDTLPIMLYCTVPDASDKKLSYFKISSYVQNERILSMLDESTFANFLLNREIEMDASGKTTSFKLHDRSDRTVENHKNIELKAIVTGILKRDSYEAMDGLRQLPTINGVTSWTVLSTPAEPYRRAFKFYHDAFTVITASERLEDFKITLYNRDIRKQDDKSFKERSYSFFTGKRI
jgi:hypothetical protein